MGESPKFSRLVGNRRRRTRLRCQI